MKSALLLFAPKALRPGWMDRTWSGSFGSAGLHVRPERSRSYLFVHDGYIEGEGLFKAAVTDGERAVGEVQRRVSLYPNGRLEVGHVLMKLEPSSQGSGFSRAFNDHAFARYSKAGVDGVTVDASMTVGGYAWARQGFELAADGATSGERQLGRARTITELVNRARRNGRLTDSQYRRLEPRLVDPFASSPQSIRSDTLTSVQELAAMPQVGPNVLLGASWKGVRRVEHGRNWWTQGAGGATDARQGIAHLSAGDQRPAAVVDAARAAAAAMPAAANPARMLAALESAKVGRGLRLAGVRRDSYATVALPDAGRAKLTTVQYHLDIIDASDKVIGFAWVGISPGERGSLAARIDVTDVGVGTAKIKRQLAKVLRANGVGSVLDRQGRTLAASR